MKAYKNTIDNSILKIIGEKEEGAKVFVVVYDKDFKRQPLQDNWISKDILTEKNGFEPYPDFQKDYANHPLSMFLNIGKNDLKEIRK